MNQLHLYIKVDDREPQELFVTVHKMDVPFASFPGYRPSEKTIAPHPMLADMASLKTDTKNPWGKPIKRARPVKLLTASGLAFARKSFTVKAGKPIKFTLENPDLLPHNWVLVKPGAKESVGQLSNLMIADPDGFKRHYVPDTDDVLVHTNVVDPKSKSTIYFRAPKKPGRYPYLCTFPGHWRVMNGEMIVE